MSVITLTPTTPITRGGTVTIKGTELQSRVRMQFLVDGKVNKKFYASVSGTFTINYVVPSTMTYGLHTLRIQSLTATRAWINEKVFTLSVVQQVPPPPVLPSAPTGLKATTSSQAANLSWEVVPLATSYKIYRDNVLIGTSIQPYFNNTGLVNGQSYAFKVSAVNIVGEGPFSNTVYGTPQQQTGSIYQITSSITSAQLLTLMADMTIDVIEMAAGTYSNLSNPTYIDGINRVTRPLTIRPAAGATVIIPGGTRPAFYWGLTSKVSYVTMQGLILDGYDFSSTPDGIMWTGWVDHLTLNSMTVRNVLGATDYRSWVLYISSDEAHSGQYITANNWTVDGHIGSTRGIGGLAMGHAPGATNITALGWNISHCKYAFYMHQDSPQPVTSAVTLSGWTVDDCGYNSGVLCAGVFGYLDGTYSNMVATNSDGLYEYGPPYMVDGGGNTGW